MSLARALLGLLSLSSPAARAASAADEDPASRSASVIARSFGAFEVDGEIGTAGPGYAARFVGGGIEFTPALGERAPRRFPVSFVLESVRRGERVILEMPPPASPFREGNFVRFARGAGIVESYEARVDGVEQTFRFESLPEGTGDLVVRGRVTTELSASSAEEAVEAIRFEMPGIGGVTWGSVTGIDAKGARARGSLRFDGTHLEMALPGEFVNRAVYPVLLDPLIGSTINVAAGASNDYSPDVAYDVTNGVYLVVWHRRYSATNRAVFGQRLLSTGAFVGPLIAITSTTQNYHSAAVANVNGSDRFLVAYTTENAGFAAVLARAVNAADGFVTPSLVIDTGVLVGTKADVGGDRGGITTAFVVVVDNNGSQDVEVAKVAVPVFGMPSLLSTLVASTSPDNEAPAIAKQGGAADQFLVTWARIAANGSRDLYARVFDLNGTFLTGETTVSTDFVADEAAPDCATKDGTHFAIVYEKRSAGPSGNSDVACRTATFDAGAGSLAVSSETILAGGLFQDQMDPAVDFAASKYLVAWASFANLGGGWNLYTMGLDPNGCVPCESVTALDTSSGTIKRFPKVGAKYSGSAAAGDGALVVWESTGTSGDIKAQRVEAMGAGGAVTALGGGCGGGGTAGVNGPVALGNANFAFTLSGAAGPAASLVLGTSQGNLACGSCTLVPALQFLLPGSSPLALPIPCNLSLLGGTLYAQWIVLAPGACPLVPGLSLSGAVSAVIGL